MGIMNALLVILQLIFASIMVMLMDELINKHGIGNGISLFIAVNISENLLWKMMSPLHVSTGGKDEYEGLVINTF